MSHFKITSIKNILHVFKKIFLKLSYYGGMTECVEMSIN